MTLNKTLGYALVTTSLVTLTACGGGSSSSSTASPKPVTIPFVAKSGDTEITCDAELLELGTTADSAKIASFAYYVYDVELVTATGVVDFTLDNNDFQDPENGVALLDYQDRNTSCTGADKATNKELTGTVDGDVDLSAVSGISFKVGIPSDLNHRDLTTNTSPYNVQSMFWSWNSGHKFMRIDIEPNANVYSTTNDNTVSTRNFHLGSTGCIGDATTGEEVSCSSENQFSVDLSGYSSSNDGQGAAVVLDLAKLLEGSNINVDLSNPVGCMSFPNDPECPVMFEKLGLPYNGSAASTQTVFSVE